MHIALLQRDDEILGCQGTRLAQTEDHNIGVHLLAQLLHQSSVLKMPVGPE